MFVHVFSYRLKCLIRNKELVFWPLLFPIGLATFFYFAFGQLTTVLEGFEPIKAVVVDNEAYRRNTQFRQVLEALFREGIKQLLDLTLADEDAAGRMLEEGSVAGIITVGDEIGFTAKQSVLHQSILK